jgi:tRNA(Ile)-lysidine synthase
LPRGVAVVRDGDEVRFLLGQPQERLSFEYQITGTGTTLIREISVYLKLTVFEVGQVGELQTYPSNTALFDLDTVSFPLLVRTFKEGDRFRPLGMSGSQKIKAFFINQKVPRWARQQCPLLLSGGKVIWVGGYRMDDSVKLTEKTKMVLKAELVAPKSKGLKRA